MPEAPLISVCIPVYNAERYLAQTLDGLLKQTLSDFEVIAVDDGSQDGSPGILRAYAARDSRLNVITRENRGIVTTRNEALAHARGRFIAVNDSDDISLPRRFELEVAFLNDHPEVVAVGGAFEMIDDAGRKLTTLRPPTGDADIQKNNLAGHAALTHSCAMIRREAIEKVGGYTPELALAHDLDLWLKLGEIGKLANLSEPVVQFRLHDKSVSETKRTEQRRLARLACENAWKRRGISGTFEADEPWRPGTDRDSRHKYLLRYGWWAHHSGERSTALIYAGRALKIAPLRWSSWQLLLHAALKPIRRAS